MSGEAPILISGGLSPAQRAAALAAIMNENVASVRAALSVPRGKECRIPLSEQGSRLNHAFFKIPGPIAKEAVIALIEELSAGPWWKHPAG